MTKPKKDNVSSLKRHKDVVEFSVGNSGSSFHTHRWQCSCRAHGLWHPIRTVNKRSLFLLWNDHLKRQHPEYDLDVEDLDNEREGIR